MKMPKELQAAFNEHICAEFYAAYSYLQLAAYCESEHLPGFAQWFRIQSEEEWAHAMRFYDHAVDRGNELILLPIAAPPSQFESPVEVFQEALTQERRVSERIQVLFALAHKVGDYPSFSLLQWFIDEQVEEENTLELIVAQLRRIGDNGAALLMLDTELGNRPAIETPPAG